MKVDNLSIMVIALVCVLLGIYICKSTDTSEAFGFGWRGGRAAAVRMRKALAQAAARATAAKAAGRAAERAPTRAELSATKVNTLCQDSPGWARSGFYRSQGCDWVAEQPGKRCRTKGTIMKGFPNAGKKKYASEHCPSVCNRNCIGL